MSVRIDKPDTQADIDLRSALDQKQSFIMTAGAGSGKTTSLVKALNYLKLKCGSDMRGRSQRVACITFTEVAAQEIFKDVGMDSMFQVSTIHSFLWSLIKPFKKDIRNWLQHDLQSRLDLLKEELANASSRVHEKTKKRKTEKVKDLEATISLISNLKNFTYGNGSDYKQGVLGHADIIKMVPKLISENKLLQELIASKYPFIFVDESQDTDPSFVQSLKDIEETNREKFCLGFFGDHMQKIYTSGVGKIDFPEGWVEIKKPENFRCSMSVLNVVNNVRKDGDDLWQTPGRKSTPPGIATIFALPNSNRDENLNKVRTWMSNKTGDIKWNESTDVNDVKILVIVHRMAANRLGFGNLYEAFNDKTTDSMKVAFSEGTLWALRDLTEQIVPLVVAHLEGSDGKVMEILRKKSPIFEPEFIKNSMDYSQELAKLLENLNTLASMYQDSNSFSVREFLSLVVQENLIRLNSNLLFYLTDGVAGQAFSKISDDEEDVEKKNSDAMQKFFNCRMSEVVEYMKYQGEKSPYSTQQGVKGAEFERVLVIIDEEEGRHNHFSYEKYFGLKELSDIDTKNIENGNDNTLARTRRLFYVCCSRALNDLAVVFFTENDTLLKQKIENIGIFEKASVLSSTDLLVISKQKTSV